MTSPFPVNLSGRLLGVYGVGASGAAAARLMAARGARVRLLDDRPVSSEHLVRLGLGSRVPDEAAAPTESGASVSGPIFEHPRRPTDPGALDDLEGVVLSPGVPLGAPGRQALAAAGLPTLGELALGARLATCPLVMITGSHGKSTTTLWVAALLEARGGRPLACGNLGRPLCEAVLAVEGGDEDADVYVVEASSFQLCDADDQLEVAAAAFCAYAPNHLDWHPDEAHYRASKLRLARAVAPGGRLVWAEGFPGLGEQPPHPDADLTLAAVGPGAGAAYRHDHDPARPGLVHTPDGDVDLADLGPGPAAVAPQVALAAALVAATPGEVEGAGSRVRPLPHRMEDLGEVAGVRFVNDSKATTPSAAAWAVSRCPQPVVQILGGKDKGLSFADHRQRFARAEALIATGAARPRVLEELADLAPEEVADFEAAVRRAAARCPAGGTVLLAPGCSSFDAFTSYEERGECFRQIVRSLARPTALPA